MRITGAPEPPHFLGSEETCLLTAVPDDGKAHRWVWSILDRPAGEILEPLPDGTVRFHAPFVIEKETYKIRVVDADNKAFTKEITIPVITKF